MTCIKDIGKGMGIDGARERLWTVITTYSRPSKMFSGSNTTRASRGGVTVNQLGTQ